MAIRMPFLVIVQRAASRWTTLGLEFIDERNLHRLRVAGDHQSTRRINNQDPT